MREGGIECDNVRECHQPVTVNEDECVLRVYCKNCYNTYVIRKYPDRGTPEMREYSRIFKRDILQGNENLFYKYHPELLLT